MVQEQAALLYPFFVEDVPQRQQSLPLSKTASDHLLKQYEWSCTIIVFRQLGDNLEDSSCL
jgi:hypothetical protein